MIFGEVLVEDAEGAILAHATRQGGLDLKKGARLSKGDIDAMRQAGLATVVTARLEPGDVGEDEAAAQISNALRSKHLSIGPAATGRVNIHATTAGVFLPDKALIDASNAIDPGITVATLPEFAPVRDGQMVATIKIIPLAVSGTSLARAIDMLGGGTAIAIAPFATWDVTVIQTVLPATRPKMLNKTRRITEDRLAVSGSRVIEELRVPHRADDLARAIKAATPSDLILIFGASAVIDRADIIPSAIGKAGGSIDYFGMPVDPGNLLLLGRLDSRPVIGAPGCARSPKENGFDWVLDRILAGLDVTPGMIQSFGVGGLLAEIQTRPRPRQNVGMTSRCVVDVVVLAAGRSSRMGDRNKLLSEITPQVPLVRRAVQTALGADGIGTVHVVLGHCEAEVRDALEDLPVDFVSNAHFAEGLSTSLQAGFEAARHADGVLVLLADQPLLTSGDLTALVTEFKGRNGRMIVAAADGEMRRNPVILPASCREAVAALSGDVGASPIIKLVSEPPILVDIGQHASFDTDTPERFEEARRRIANDAMGDRD